MLKENNSINYKIMTVQNEFQNADYILRDRVLEDQSV